MLSRHRASAPIYVETLVRAPMEDLWRLTQDPAQHTRWDLRFSSIRYLPSPDPQQPQEFRYAVDVLPGVRITGTGRTLGERSRPDGSRTSALGWERDTSLSPLGAGRGYWRYVPVDTETGAAVRFFTGYDYEPGWGAASDRLVRPLIGWATAWSFDRLRLMLERQQAPERSLVYALLDGGARLAIVLAAAVAASGGDRWRVARAAVAAAAATVAVSVVPIPDAVPSAARCHRRPPDDASSLPPATIERVSRFSTAPSR